MIRTVRRIMEVWMPAAGTTQQPGEWPVRAQSPGHANSGLLLRPELVDIDTAEKDTHTALQSWYLNDDKFAQQNLNIIAGDFVESRGIVDLAIVLNRLMGAPGARVQAPDDPAIYLIDSDGTRRHVPDPQTLVNLFGPTPAIIQRPVSDITAGPELTSGAYLAADGGKEYLVTNGEKRWIMSPDVFNQFAFGGTVRNQSLAALPDGPDLTGTWQVRPGLLLQAPGHRRSTSSTSTARCAISRTNRPGRTCTVTTAPPSSRTT